MSDPQAATPATVEQLPTPARSSVVSDELTRLLGDVRAMAPKDADIHFQFDGKLHLHIDMHKLEDVARMEVLLPTLCGSIFSNIRRGLVDNHPFLHRLTALVDR